MKVSRGGQLAFDLPDQTRNGLMQYNYDGHAGRHLAAGGKFPEGKAAPFCQLACTGSFVVEAYDS